MNLAKWLERLPEASAKTGPGKALGEALDEAGPGSLAQPLSYAALLARRRAALEKPHG